MPFLDAMFSLTTLDKSNLQKKKIQFFSAAPCHAVYNKSAVIVSLDPGVKSIFRAIIVQKLRRCARLLDSGSSRAPEKAKKKRFVICHTSTLHTAIPLCIIILTCLPMWGPRTLFLSNKNILYFLRVETSTFTSTSLRS